MPTIQSSLIKLLDTELPGRDNRPLVGKIIATMSSVVTKQIAQAEKEDRRIPCQR